MVDTPNTFNAINQEAFLHNTKILCPSISTYINNCYSSPTDLYIQGGRSVKSEEGTTTQGDPTTLAIYVLGIAPLLASLSKKSSEGESTSASKQDAFAHGLNGLATVESLEKGGHSLKKKEKIGSSVNARKSNLTVKEQFKDKAKEIFKDSNIKISTEGHRHFIFNRPMV